MEMDLTKLGKLIEKCSDAGVKKLKLGELEVDFSTKDNVADVPVQAQEKVQIISPDDEERDRAVQEDKSFEEEMLHLTDPAAWQRSLLDPENDEDSVAVGGDEESELRYEH